MRRRTGDGPFSYAEGSKGNGPTYYYARDPNLHSRLYGAPLHFPRRGRIRLPKMDRSLMGHVLCLQYLGKQFALVQGRAVQNSGA
jgi:hypothetical protein